MDSSVDVLRKERVSGPSRSECCDKYHTSLTSFCLAAEWGGSTFNFLTVFFLVSFVYDKTLSLFILKSYSTLCVWGAQGTRRVSHYSLEGRGSGGLWAVPSVDSGNQTLVLYKSSKYSYLKTSLELPTYFFKLVTGNGGLCLQSEHWEDWGRNSPWIWSQSALGYKFWLCHSWTRI